jgi:hypothetical protein
MNYPSGPYNERPGAGLCPSRAHVPALAPGDQQHRLLVAAVVQLAHGGGVDARDPARPELKPRAVAKLELHLAAVHEVGFLLALVVVGRRVVVGRQHERIDAKRVDAQLAADLAKAVARAHRVDVADGVAVALNYVLIAHGG